MGASSNRAARRATPPRCRIPTPRRGCIVRACRTRSPRTPPRPRSCARASTPATPLQVLTALARPYKHDEFAAPASNGQIAAELHLSVDAVKAHLRMLFQRFGIEALPPNQKRSRLVAEALQSGIVSPRDL